VSQKLAAAIPPNLHLPANWIVRFAALDPTTGAAVNGVTVSGASLIVQNITGGDLSAGLFEAQDITWLNVPVEGDDGT